MKRKVSGAWVAVRSLEEFQGERFRALCLSEGDEDLTDAEERTRRARVVAEVAEELETLLERLERSLVVARIVDQKPAEDVERRRELVPIAQHAPESDRFVEPRPSRVGVSETGRQSPGRSEGPGA